MRHIGVLFAAAIVSGACSSAAPPPPMPPSPPASETPPANEAALVEAVVRPLLDGGWVTGIVVGLADAAGPRTYGFGGLDGDSLVELGATTEVFTGILYQDALEQGRIFPDDPVRDLLPPGVTFPEGITVEQLVLHTAGLPRLPDNLAPRNASDPFADYGVDDLYAFASRFRPAATAPAEFAISNVGIALLARLIASDYEAALVERVLGPLGMTRTRVRAEGLVQGHDGDLNPVGPWSFDALAGAAGLRSTANELLLFLGASLGYVATPLAGLLRAVQQPKSERMATGWHRMEDGTTLWHNGQTGGYHSFLALDTRYGRGIVVLSNTSTPVVDDVGLVLLGKLDAPRLRTTVSLTPEQLDVHVGRYRLSRNVVLEVVREGDRLVLRSPGEPPSRLWPESETEFYVRVSDLRITFEPDAMVLHRADGDVRAPRVRR